MFTFYFNKNSKTPLYVQLYQFLRNEIEKGTYQQNVKMPSKRKLSTHLKISQITVDSAYQQLVAEGYLVSVPKSGFYVGQYDLSRFIQNPVDKKIPIIEYKESEAYDYDFKTNVVDVNLFPNTTWVKLAREVLSDNNYEMLNVTHPQGLYVLREEIAKYLFNFRGIRACAEQIIVGSGLESLMSLIIKLIGRTKVYAVENPGYNKMFHIFNNNDVLTIPISLDDQGLRVSELKHTTADIVHVTPSHQFPLGIVMPIRRRQELLNWANETDGRYILEDDYDSEFRFYGQPIPALETLDDSQKVLYINSFSKSIAPSLRISYLVLPPNLLNEYKKNISFYSSSVPNFEQYILYKFMQGGYFERHINRMRVAYKARLEAIIQFIQSSPLSKIIKIFGHDAGLHFLMQVDNKMTEAELVKKAKQVSIKLYGLSEYYHYDNSNVPSSTIVFGYSSLSIEDIQRAFKRLEKVWL